MSRLRRRAPLGIALLAAAACGSAALAAPPPMSVEPDAQTLVVDGGGEPADGSPEEVAPSDPDAALPMTLEPAAQSWAGGWDLRLPGAEPAGGLGASPAGVVIKKEWANKLEHTDPTGRLWIQDTWNLEVETLVGPSFERDWPFPFAFTARLRVGALLIREPMFWNVGAYADYSTWDAGAFGVMGEVMHFTSGTWAQLSAFIDTDARMGFGVAGGWSLFGAEVQMRNDPHRDLPVWSVHAKVRIPIRMFLFAAGI